ncbi:MAG: fumarate hydratase [Ardenticatenaceae bacterium]|nr:fumarate hydratase [Ardenticatenaceae bacterium]
MTTPDLTEAFLELIRRTATDLSGDVEQALQVAREKETEGSPARSALDTILENVAVARKNSTPICQDTGTTIFYVHYPEGWSTRALRAQIETALTEATRRAYLRPNAVNPITGKNTGNNLGEGVPTIHFEEWEERELKADLMLKGGGCENVSAQYSLPNAELKAGRDLEGVRRVALDAVYKAQGKGCAPGILGIAVGGDRGVSYVTAKEQLFRTLDEASPEPEVAALEQRLTGEANQLGIGPMGFGGQTTLLATQIGTPHRHPASFFVTVAYMCWAHRRRSLTWRDGEYQVT